MIAATKAVSAGTQQAERVLGAESYRAEIDGLRGVAVLAVIGFHAFPDYFPGGFVGVDVFFVISGFLISSIITRQLRRSTFTFSQFYARRIRRIFPALILVSTACLLFGAFALLPDEFEELGKHVASAASFVSNFTLWRESGYFDQAAELKPLLHLWSLGVEEQFYLLWPLLLLLLWKKQPQRVATNVLLLTLASFALALGIGQEYSTASFYLPFSRAWELGLGCLLAVIRESPEPTKHWFDKNIGLGSRFPSLASYAQSALPLAGIGLIAAAIFLFDRDTAFPGWAALIPTLGAMCVISAREDSWLQRRVMASAALVFIGLISYPLYLWHWPILSFAVILQSGTPTVGARVIAVLLSAALAWLTFRYFERPIRACRSIRVIIVLVAGLWILGIVGLAMYSAQGLPNRFDFDVRTIRPGPRSNSLCVRNFPERAGFNYCKSTSSEPPSAVFLGDSRTQAVYDGVVDLVGAHESLTLLARGGCPPLLNVDLHFVKEQGCIDVWNTFVKYIADVKPSVVVLVGGGADLLDDSGAALETNRFENREEAFEHGLRELLVALQRTSRVIYVLEFPQFHSTPNCFLRRIKLPGSQCSPTMSRNDVEARMAPHNRIVRAIQSELLDLDVVDSIDVLCDATRCSQKVQSGEIIYRDQLHLSPAGGRYFARRSGLVRRMTGELVGDH